MFKKLEKHQHEKNALSTSKDSIDAVILKGSQLAKMKEYNILYFAKQFIGQKQLSYLFQIMVANATFVNTRNVGQF